jgi:hypothetical protein
MILISEHEDETGFQEAPAWARAWGEPGNQNSEEYIQTQDYVARLFQTCNRTQKLIKYQPREESFTFPRSTCGLQPMAAIDFYRQPTGLSTVQRSPTVVP